MQIIIDLFNIQKNEQRNNDEEIEIGVVLPAAVNLAVGVAAGISQVLLITPINVALTRIKTNSPPATLQSNGLIPVIFKIAKRYLTQS